MVRSTAQRLHHALRSGPRPDAISLLSGKGGVFLGEVLAARGGEAGWPEHLSARFQELAEQAAGTTYLPLCGGLAGINWLYHYLHRLELLDADDLALLVTDPAVFQQQALRYLRAGNYDFLHGAIGIAYYLFSIRPDPADPFYEAFFTLLEESLANDCGMVQDYDSQAQTVVPGRVNLGLAHGIPSVLKCCLQAHRLGICAPAARRIGEAIVSYLLRHVNEDRSASWYPTFLQGGSQKAGRSRLAWCYGDLPLGYVLFQAGNAFGDAAARDFALELLHHTTGRRSVEATSVFDAGLCHGSAGVAHLYNRLWHTTGDAVFREAADFWMRKTLDFATYDDGVAGFKKFNPADKSWLPDYGMLEGAAGISLVLYSYETGDFDWDYCLMLND